MNLTKRYFKSAAKKAALIGCTAMLMLGSAVPAFAYSDENADTEQTVQETETVEDTTSSTDVLEERVIGEDTENAFSVSGNAEVVDDITDSDSKEFYTIRTKNNNTFYLIVDRSATTDNVYMLSTIDENDLAEFLEDTEEEAATEVVVIPENTVTPDTQTQEETTEEETVEQTETSSGLNTAAIAAIAILLVGGVGAFYYFKKIKPEQESDDNSSEGMEYGESIRYEEDEEYLPNQTENTSGDSDNQDEDDFEHDED